MVTSFNSQQEKGKNLLSVLDDENMGIKAAFWLFYPDTELWKILLWSPKLEELGPKKAYEKILTILEKYKEQQLPDLDEIVVIKSDEKILRLLRVAIQTPSEGISSIRFSKSVINGHFIDEAYIYRLSS